MSPVTRLASSGGRKANGPSRQGRGEITLGNFWEQTDSGGKGDLGLVQLISLTIPERFQNRCLVSDPIRLRARVLIGVVET